MKRRKRRTSGYNGKVFKPISIEDACKILHCSDRHYQRIKKHLDVRRDGRRVLVNELAVHRYLARLPHA